MKKRTILSMLLVVTFLLTACGGKATEVPTAIPPSPTASPDLPKILSIVADHPEVPRYDSIEFTIDLDAKYSNPYDVREVALDGLFTAPDGKVMKVPGFWDSEGAWRMRFTPSQEGVWNYAISITDARGQSLPSEGEFSVSASDLHGWLIPGNMYDPSYSSHYLVYHDGTPFYGVGHCDAFSLLSAGFNADTGVGLFDDMKAANENYVVWWPLYSNSFINEYNNYSVGAMKIIDLVVKDAQKKGVALAFTIWDHPELRDETHAWGRGNWSANGFSKLSDINSFFTADEPWAWQENLYRYMIARWGYSPAIGLWLTVSEINGTNSYNQTDPWHTKVNQYFVENDPYRHPTSASGAGEYDWPAGHVVMDMPQVHLYDFDHGVAGDSNVNDAVGAAAHVAEWTQKMLKEVDKPNWIGEFGTPGNTYYPELFHNSIWAALGAGAAMTPAEWNSGGAWGEMTPEMHADISRFSQFVSDVPLAHWNPSAIDIKLSNEQVRAWGVAGNSGGLVWIQDFSLEGKPIEEVRNQKSIRSNVQVTVKGLPSGTYIVLPYNTWTGEYYPELSVSCSETDCAFDLPDFTSDLAVKLLKQ